MNKRNINYLIDIIILIIFSIVGITGIIIFPNLLKIFGININNLPKVYLYKYHHWFGLLLLIITTIHIDRYWKLFLHANKKFFIGIKELKIRKFDEKKNIKHIINLLLIISYSLLFFTGVIKFPGFLPFIGLNPLSIPLNIISFVHDYSGFFAVILSLLHILFYLKRFLTKTKKNIHSLYFLLKNNKKKVILFILILITFIVIFSYINNEKNYNFNFFKYSENKIIIEGIGTYPFSPNDIETIRKDIFAEGSFSIFDILFYLNSNESINLEYHYDESMNTYVIDLINDKENWWYIAHYDGGWSENNVFRMDHFPYKDNMYIHIIHEDSINLDRIYNTFKDEIRRKTENDERIIIPSVKIRGPTTNLIFNNVEVKPHNLRNDTFQNGVVTAIDVILTLNDENKLSHKLQWYDSIGSAEIVRSY